MEFNFAKSALCLSLITSITLSYAQTNPVRLGQIVPLTGGLANVGKEINEVTKATIERHNTRAKLKLN